MVIFGIIVGILLAVRVVGTLLHIFGIMGRLCLDGWVLFWFSFLAYWTRQPGPDIAAGKSRSGRTTRKVLWL